MAVCPTLDPAVKLKLGAEFAEKENGFAVLSLLLLLLLLVPNWNAPAAGWLLTVELDPNSNIFLEWGSSPVVVVADVPLPKGLLDPNAGEAAPNIGAADELDVPPNVGAEDAAD